MKGFADGAASFVTSATDPGVLYGDER